MAGRAVTGAHERRSRRESPGCCAGGRAPSCSTCRAEAGCRWPSLCAAWSRESTRRVNSSSTRAPASTQIACPIRRRPSRRDGQQHEVLDRRRSPLVSASEMHRAHLGQRPIGWPSPRRIAKTPAIVVVATAPRPTTTRRAGRWPARSPVPYLRSRCGPLRRGGAPWRRDGGLPAPAARCLWLRRSRNGSRLQVHEGRGELPCDAVVECDRHAILIRLDDLTKAICVLVDAIPCPKRHAASRQRLIDHVRYICKYCYITTSRGAGVRGRPAPARPAADQRCVSEGG